MDSNAASTPLLEIEGLVAGYGSVPALHGVSFTVADGSCVAVLGPNGAGKSTLARAIGGFLTPMDGRIVFDGVDITNMPPHEVSRLGLVRLPETRGIFPSLTVEENLTLGLMRAQTKSERKEAMERVHEEFPLLHGRRRQVAGTLSGGEQQLLALCHIVAIPPRLLIADELSLGLAPIVLDRIYQLIGKVREAGVAIVLIEQFFDRALGFADHVLAVAPWDGRGRCAEFGSAGH